MFETPEETTLTFTDNTNLQYFKAGDHLVNSPYTGLLLVHIPVPAALKINGVGPLADFIWIKRTDGESDHGLHDTLRGTSSELSTNNANPPDTQAKFASFDSDGWTMNGSYGTVNINGQEFEAFVWDAGNEPAVTTDSGGLTVSTLVKANVDTGFSVCRYDGGSGNNSYSHGLGKTPDFVLVKRLSNDNS